MMLQYKPLLGTRIYVQKVRLNRGGYDRRGRYHGGYPGVSLYRFTYDAFIDGRVTAVEHFEYYVDRADAVRVLKECYPESKVW